MCYLFKRAIPSITNKTTTSYFCVLGIHVFEEMKCEDKMFYFTL